MKKLTFHIYIQQEMSVRSNNDIRLNGQMTEEETYWSSVWMENDMIQVVWMYDEITLSNADEMWIWSENQRSRIQTVTMCHLIGGCGVCDESLYGRFGMSSRDEE